MTEEKFSTSGINGIITHRGFTVLFERACLDSDVPPFSFIGIGLGSTPPDINDSSLEYEIGRWKANYNHIPGSTSFVLSTTIPKEKISGLLSEIGIFNKQYGGDLFARAIIVPPKWKSVGQALPVAWKFTF
jgi:hypothetical protein